MRRKLVRIFNFGCLITGLVASVTSCGSQNPYADALTISISPTKNLLIGPGPSSSCVDMATYKVAQETAGGTPAVLGQSVSGPVVTINTFSLEWKSTDTLYVEDIRITVTGPGISGGSIIQDMQTNEIEDLLATNLAIINPNPTLTAGNPQPSPDVVIVSSDANTRSPTTGYYAVYAPCSFVIGSLGLTNGNKTQAFTANITIQVIGTAADQQGNNQRLVEYTVTATAMYYGS